jgi:hypothetical protein
VIKEGAWFERTWTFEMPVTAFPAVLERLRGTHVRMAELIVGATDDQLRRHDADAWSAKRHLGHLDDLHALDERRLREYLAGAATLTAADLTNRLTWETDHDALRHRKSLLALARIGRSWSRRWSGCQKPK